MLRYKYIPLNSFSSPHIDVVLKLLIRTDYTWSLGRSGKHVMDSYATAILLNNTNKTIMLDDSPSFILESELSVDNDMFTFLREPYDIKSKISKVDWMLINDISPFDILLNRIFKRILLKRPHYIGRDQIHHIERIAKSMEAYTV